MGRVGGQRSKRIVSPAFHFYIAALRNKTSDFPPASCRLCLRCPNVKGLSMSENTGREGDQWELTKHPGQGWKLRVEGQLVRLQKSSVTPDCFTTPSPWPQPNPCVLHGLSAGLSGTLWDTMTVAGRWLRHACFFNKDIHSVSLVSA